MFITNLFAAFAVIISLINLARSSSSVKHGRDFDLELANSKGRELIPADHPCGAKDAHLRVFCDEREAHR